MFKVTGQRILDVDGFISVPKNSSHTSEIAEIAEYLSIIMFPEASSVGIMVEASPLLRLPPELRQMILKPLLIVDDILHCPSRVFGNRLVSWMTMYGVQTDMMFTCQLLYHEVLETFLRENDFSFSAPPTTTLFPCAKYAERAKSVTFRVHSTYWKGWESYLSANTLLVVKNLKIHAVTHMIGSPDHDSLISGLFSVCEFFIESVLVTEKFRINFSSLAHSDIRRRCLSLLQYANTDIFGRPAGLYAKSYISENEG